MSFSFGGVDPSGDWNAKSAYEADPAKSLHDLIDQRRISAGLPPIYDTSKDPNGANTMGGFVNQNASPSNPAFETDFTNSGNLLAKYLQTSPTSAPNRFEGALEDSTSRLNSLLDNPDSIQQSAAYKFRLGQGLEGVNRSMAARGMLGSGNRLAALNDYAQGQASQEYGDQFNRLAGLLGQNTNAWLGDKNANTSAWNAKAGALGNYYQSAANNAIQSEGQNNANRLGWASLYQRGYPSGVSHSSSNTSSLYGYLPAPSPMRTMISGSYDPVTKQAQYE